jgi:hypothetical protein
MARIDGVKVNQRWPQARDMYKILEDRGHMQAVSRIAPHGGAFGLHGVYVRVRSAENARDMARLEGKRFVHRVLVRCDCEQEIPFGKLGQHRKACSANVYADA